MNSSESIRHLPDDPFPGIEPYSFAERDIFFARPEELRSLIRLVVMYRGVLLYSASGTGKSSLINAGLIPHALDEGFSPVRIRVQPRRDEEIVIGRIVDKTGAELTYLPSIFDFDEDQERPVLPVDDFVRIVRMKAKETYPLLIFDQFEEWITLFESASVGQPATDVKFSRDRIRDAIASLLNDNSLRVKILIAFREDYLASLTPLFRLCPSLQDECLRLMHLKTEQVLQAIRGPFEKKELLGRYRPAFTPELAGEITTQLQERAMAEQIHLTEVQIVCRSLWDKRGDAKDFDELFKKLGGVQGILERYLESSLQSLPEHQQQPAVALLSRMVTPAGTRNVVSRDDLLSLVQMEEGIPLDLLGSTLDNLEKNTKLVQRERRRNVYYYEIENEFLISWIQKKSQERQRLLQEQKLVEEERQRRLQEQAKTASRLRKLSIALAGVFLLAVVAALIAGRQATRAHREARFSLARELAAAAVNDLNLDPQRSLLLALHSASLSYSVDKSVTTETQNALHRTLPSLRLMQSLAGHKGWVYDVAFSSDGRLLATSSSDPSVKVWDAGTGRELHTLLGFRDGVLAVAFSPDPTSSTLATASADSSVILWDAMSGKRLRTLVGHQGGVTAVAFDAEGRRLASASYDGTVRIWDVRSGEALHTFYPDVGHVFSVAFDPDGKRLVVAGENGLAAVWEVSSARRLFLLRGHEWEINATAFSRNGKWIATAGRDVTARVWDATTGELKTTLSGHTNTVQAVAFSPDSRRLATASLDRTAKVWDVAEGRELFTISGHNDYVHGVDFSPDGSQLATASFDGSAKVWSAQPGQELLTLTHSAAVNQVVYSSDGKRLASASRDGRAIIWDAETGGTVAIIRSYAELRGVAFSRDGSRLATCGSGDTVKVWDVASSARLLSLPLNSTFVHSVIFSPDGKRLAAAGLGGQAIVWDANKGTQLLTLSGPSGTVYEVTFSPDGKYVATANANGTAVIWDGASGAPLDTLIGHTNRVQSVSFSPDGEYLLTTSADATAKIWEVKAGKELLTLAGHTDLVWRGTYSPDGALVATASFDKTTRIWDARSGQELLVLPGHSNWVKGLAFSPNGKHLVSCSEDNTIRMYTLDVKELISLALSRLSRSLTVQERNKKYLHEEGLESIVEAVDLLVRGKNAARDGNFNGAIEKIREATKLDPLIDVDPAVEARRLAARSLVSRGEWLVRQDSVIEGIAAYRRAQELDSTQISPESWNALCWWGSLLGHATEVMFACQKAVELAPANGGIRDSRGLARALTGDSPGAIEDFSAYLRWDFDKERLSRRQRWIKTLKAGGNPFMARELEQLRHE
jgi:WD40 repeat protein